MSKTDPELVTGHARRVQTAATYLRDGGATVLDTDWSCTHGIADIVYTERHVPGSELVVVKVQTPDAPLSRADVRRLRLIGVTWMTAHGVSFDNVRVDSVRVHLLAYGQSNLEHESGVPE